MDNKLLFIPVVLLGMVGFFLVFEHRVHLLGAVPYLFFVIFIGLHFFMHIGMGHGGKHEHDNKKKGENHE
ncbi:MAG: DUF2933 domain-containing protein [Patescibacteria group bacterium]|nr:DUF2933 domain-containing protein [Patescibacteria group bacterium]